MIRHAIVGAGATVLGMHRPAARPFPVDLPPGEADHAAILDGTPLSSDGVQGRLSLELANTITLSSQRGTTVDLPLDRAEYLTLLEDLRHVKE